MHSAFIFLFNFVHEFAFEASALNLLSSFLCHLLVIHHFFVIWTSNFTPLSCSLILYTFQSVYLTDNIFPHIFHSKFHSIFWVLQTVELTPILEIHNVPFSHIICRFCRKPFHSWLADLPSYWVYLHNSWHFSPVQLDLPK